MGLCGRCGPQELWEQGGAQSLNACVSVKQVRCRATSELFALKTIDKHRLDARQLKVGHTQPPPTLPVAPAVAGGLTRRWRWLTRGVPQYLETECEALKLIDSHPNM